jgi:hypothetical protein
MLVTELSGTDFNAPPFRGWCYLSWGQTLVPPDMANYERRVLHR